MNKITLIWTLIAAVPVGVAALTTAYVYRDTGKLPFQETVETASETAGGSASAPADAPAVAAGGVEETDETAVAEVEPSAKAGPSFDVVGVEPTGETVVAGRSEAGAIVALTANGKVVGKSIANEAGEWTIILDEPLKPGDYDVGLEIHDETGAPIATSDEHLAVSLSEGGKEQPLVVLNSPDGPSDILQKPQAETEVAAASPEPQAAAEETVARDEPATPTAEAAPETAVAALPSDAQASGTESAPAAATDSQASAAPEETVGDKATGSAAPAGTQDVAEATPPQTEPAETDVAAAEDAGAAAGSGAAQPTATEDVASAAEEPVQQAAAQTSPDEGAPSAPGVSASAAPASGSVTVEAVEAEKGKVFVAGTGNPGASVRVYVGDEFQGEAKVNASGRWLVEGSKTIAEGNVEVRADQIGGDGNSVDARAAVTFEKEQDKQIVLTKVVATGASGGAEGQGAEVKKSLPVVIIRKGDNLWRISRRLYGDGIRYTTIYQANQDQIRNPDLIYPGQVFLTPEGDLNWKPTPENNG